jgi:hypothetical protein
MVSSGSHKELIRIPRQRDASGRHASGDDQRAGFRESPEGARSLLAEHGQPLPPTPQVKMTEK